ncbi:hypothetical protein BDR05DRAFT_949203 [Suillus weaverae]|nr:hypothetical protein BDR05DRAFT_949203 [Suillus weaverae]
MLPKPSRLLLVQTMQGTFRLSSNQRAKEKEKKSPPPEPDSHIEDLMVDVNNAPSTCDLEDEHVDSAANPSCGIEDNLPNDIMDPVIDNDFTMGEELNYNGHKQQLDTMQEDQAEVEKNIGLEVDSVHGQVKTLTSNMLYIYTMKAAASEYKIAKINTLHQEHDLNFQHERAELECTEAIVLHQHCQEAKTLDLQVLEAQAKIHAERKATLQLKIELLKLKGGVE